jgi:hypothetical protein
VNWGVDFHQMAPWHPSFSRQFSKPMIAPTVGILNASYGRIRLALRANSLIHGQQQFAEGATRGVGTSASTEVPIGHW